MKMKLGAAMNILLVVVIIGLFVAGPLWLLAKGVYALPF